MPSTYPASEGEDNLPEIPTSTDEEARVDISLSNTPDSLIKEERDDAVEAAKEEGEFFNIHMDAYVAMMRIKFAWMVFTLVVVWLLADLYIIFSVGTKILNLTFLYSFIGGSIGLVIGMMRCHVCNNEATKKEFKPEVDKLDRLHKARLMLWRGYGHSVWISLLTGGVLGAGSTLTPWVASSNVEFAGLENQVLIALIVSTTASVIGILLIVMYWLFPKTSNEGK